MTMTYIVERILLRPPVQFFHPLSRRITAFREHGNVHSLGDGSQEEQQGAHPTSLVRDPPHGIQVIRLRGGCASSGGN